MRRLIDGILDFLRDNGFECNVHMHSGLDVIYTRTFDDRHEKVLIPLEIAARNPEEAEARAHIAAKAIDDLPSRPIIITEDRWRSQQEMMKARVLAHLEVFDQVYARNCEIRKIDKATAAEFLAANHSYGDSSNRYRYGLFLKRHTGHIATEGDETWRYPTGTMVAVATFSNARKWVKGERSIRSYEWIRYASLPGLRISGGMGKILKAFIEDVQPDDIMSYADLEWSNGEVYKTLGFAEEAFKEPVVFAIDSQWKRTPVSKCPQHEGSLYFQNFGSLKYRMRLAEA